MCAGKTGVAAIQTQIGALIDLLLLSAAKAEDDFVFLGNDLGKINAHVRRVAARARSVSVVMRNLGAMDHRLGRRASDIDACAAQILFLDERHGPTKIRQSIGEGIAALARTDDDCIVFHAVLHGKMEPRLYLRRSNLQSKMKHDRKTRRSSKKLERVGLIASG